MSQINFDLSESVEIYQSAINRLINQIGKKVRLFYKLDLNLTEDQVDNLNMGNRKPIYKTSNVTEDDRYEHKDIICTIAWQRRFDDDQASLQVQKARCSIKTNVEHLPDILRADFIVPSYDVDDYYKYRFRIHSAPVPTGLKEDIFVKVYLEQMFDDD